MKRLYIFLCICFTGFVAHAQDVIITHQGDTIKCQITKVDSRYIYYRYLQQGSVQSALLSLSEVTKYSHLVPGNKSVSNQYLSNKEYPSFMLSFGGGYSYRLAKIPDNPIPSKEYLQKLKNGYNLEGQGGYFFSKKYGLGLRYSYFRSKNYLDSVVLIRNDGHTIDTLRGDLGDDVRLQNIGPVFYFRFYNRDESMTWLMGLGIGYTNYLDKARLIGEDFKISGGTISLTISLGADFRIYKHVSLGATISIDTGTLASITTTYGGTKQSYNLDDSQRENLAKVNLTGYLRLWK